MLAHEIGHWWHSHTFWRLVVAQVQLFVLFALFSQFVGDVAMFRSFGFDVDSEGAYLPTIVAFMVGLGSRRGAISS